jgi:hypothetical protein
VDIWCARAARYTPGAALCSRLFFARCADISSALRLVGPSAASSWR